MPPALIAHAVRENANETGASRLSHKEIVSQMRCGILATSYSPHTP